MKEDKKSKFSNNSLPDWVIQIEKLIEEARYPHCSYASGEPHPTQKVLSPPSLNTFSYWSIG